VALHTRLYKAVLMRENVQEDFGRMLDEVHGLDGWMRCTGLTSSLALAVVCCWMSGVCTRLVSFGLFFRSGMLWHTLAKLFEMEWCD
jgi:hypothetical protein